MKRILAMSAILAVAAQLPAGETRRIEYSRLLFGSFIEQFDNVVYGGIYDPGSPLSDEDGFRKDVIDALKEIKCSIVRWPGGCFASAYHWKDAIGPVREPVWDKAWNCEEPNTFGTDEFIKWCRKVGCEPYLCTNAGSGDGEEMSDWVQYCNLNEGRWGRRRIANGHPEPYNVKYWSIGNENGGGHEIGRKRAEDWGFIACESAKMMRAADRSIFLAAAGSPVTEKWNKSLLAGAGRLIDFICVHTYPDKLLQVDNPSGYMKCMMWTCRAENMIANVSRQLDEAGFGGGKIGIAIDEWNLRSWHHPGFGKFERGSTMDVAARRRNDRAATYTMADAVFVACFLDSCIRHGDVVKMANFAPVVNCRGAVFVHPKGIVKRTTWYVLRMYANLLEKYAVPSFKAECGELSFEGARVPVLDTLLTESEDGSRKALAAVNKHPADEQELDVSSLGAASALRAVVLDGDSPDAYNDIGAEERVAERETVLSVREGKVTLPPHSVSIIFFGGNGNEQ